MKPINTVSLAREKAANACVDAINTDFFKAFCEPARVAIFSRLVRLGRSDIGTIAQDLPQDRSVVARHLQIMASAGLVSAQAQGRHTYYDIDGPQLLAQVDSLSKLIRQLMPACCAK
jgi:DNA-binding transcriptional ArsR family regulator